VPVKFSPDLEPQEAQDTETFLKGLARVGSDTAELTVTWSSQILGKPTLVHRHKSYTWYSQILADFQ